MGISAAIMLAAWGPGAPVTLKDLDVLVAQYRRFELPIPPPDAPLVRDGSKAETFEGVYLLSCSRTEARVLRGTIVEQIDARRGFAPVSLTPAAGAKVQIFTYHRLFAEEGALAVAAIERIRGNTRFALSVLQAYVDRYRDREPKRVLDLMQAAAALAKDHWLCAMMEPGSDRREALRRLEGLRARLRTLFSNSENRTLSGLRLAVTRRYEGTDEVERLIDSLCDSLSGAQAYSMSFIIAMSQRDSGDNRSAALLPIFALGYKAIPALLRHAGDQRLSRGTQERTNMAFTGPAEATVGDICLNIVEQFSTIPRELYSNREREGRLRKWWQSAKELSDRENFVAAVESHANSNLPAGLLAWAEGQPTMLVEAYRNALDSGRPNAAADLLDSLRRSKSDRQTILEHAGLGLNAELRTQFSAP